MTVVENREVLTQEYGELSMEPGGESTRDWVGVGTQAPTATYPPNQLRPVLLHRVSHL